MRSIWVTLVVLVLGGCDSAAPAPAESKSRLPIVATVYPLCDLARAIGGRSVEVRWWIESGQEIATYQPSPAHVEDLRRAAVVLSGGVAEAYATEEFEAKFGDHRLIRLDTLAPADQRVPLMWLDPAIAKTTAKALADRLAALELESAAEFRAAAERFSRDVDQLVSDFDTRLIGLGGTTVASIGNNYTALARPFGFTVVQINESPAVLLDEQAIAKAQKQVKSSGAILLLIEADTPLAVVKNLQAKMPVPVLTIDSLGSSSTAGHDTYLKMMRYNYEQLLDGMGRVMRR